MSLKILVVDDRPEDRRTVTQVLRHEPAFAKYQLRILEASDGAEGIEVFKRERPDLVIADLLMPRLDGFAFCHAVRELPEGREVPILVLSGVYKDLAVATRLKNTFGAELLAKPIQLRRFAARALAAIARVAKEAPAEEMSWRTATATSLPAVTPSVAVPRVEEVQDQQLDEGADEEAPAATVAVGGTRAPLDGRPPAIDFGSAQHGTLSRHPLAWLLVQAAAAHTTGTLRLTRGKLRKAAFLVEGRPIYVDSNLRNETLGAYLVSRGVLAEADLAKALKQAQGSGRKLGEVLVSLGLVDERTVEEGLRGQVRLKLAGALRWPDGAFSWLPGDDFSQRLPSCAIDGVELALAALKKLTPPDEISLELAPHLDRVLGLTPQGERLRERIESVFGTSMLRQLLSGASLRETLAAERDVPAQLVQLYALCITGLAELGAAPALAPPPSASSQPALEQPPERAKRALFGLSDLEPAASPRTISAVIDISEIELVEPGGDEPPIYADREDSGVLHVPAVDDLELDLPAAVEPLPAPTPPTTTIALPPEPRGLEEFRELVRRAASQIYEHDFYEILELPRDATPSQIDEAYRRALGQYALRGLGAALPDAESAELADITAIIAQAHGVLSDPIRRQTYDQTLREALAQPAPAPDAFGAELHYQQGHTLLRDKAFAEAVAAFERAVRGNPLQPDYHAHLGWSLFLARGRGEAGAMASRPHLAEALRIAPDSALAHELAGHVERDARRWREAAEHLAHAVAAGSPRIDLFAHLKEILGHLEAWEELERQYRQLIFRLREKEPLKTVPLWVDLAYLYQHRLGQLDNARVSLQVASRLAPADPQVKAAIAAFEAAVAPAAQATEDWQPIAEACRRRLLASLDDPTPLHELAALHLGAGRDQLALVPLTLLAKRGAATPAEARRLAELAPPGGPLVPARRALTADELALLREEEGQAELALIASLSPLLARVAPITLESLGSSEVDLLAEIALPQPFRDLFRYSCATLGLAPPPIYLSASLGYGALPLAGDEIALVVGQELVDGEEEQRSAFEVARSLACLDPARRHLFARPASVLKAPVLATISFFRPGARVQDTDGAIASFLGALRDSAPDPRRGELVKQLVAEKKLNLSAWRRAVRRAAARIALCVCGDLGVALDAVRAEAEVLSSLELFALDERYLELRRGLARGDTGPYLVGSR